MKRKIVIASFFVTIIVLAQLTFVAPSVIADDGDTSDELIELEEEELNRLENAIEKFSDTELYDQLISKKEEMITEEGEVTVSGLHNMIIFLNEYFDKFILNSIESINNFIEFLSMIIFIIMIGIATIPVLMFIDIAIDIIELFKNGIEIIFDIAIIINIPYLSLIPGLYLLIEDLSRLIDSIVNEIPLSKKERREYIRENFKEARSTAFKITVILTAKAIWNGYIKSPLGYVGEFAGYFANICWYSKEVVKDTLIGLEQFKTIFIDPAKAFFELLKAKPLEKIREAILFVDASLEAISEAKRWIFDIGIWIEMGLYYPGEDFYYLVDYLDSAYEYFSSDPSPWWKPITVVVEIKNDASEKVTVTFDSASHPEQYDSITVDVPGTYELTFYTEITDSPASFHTINLTAVEEDGTVKTAQTSAFSDGEVEVEFDFEESKSKPKSVNSVTSLRARFLTFLGSFQRLSENNPNLFPLLQRFLNL
jgi:hypothetical protein